MPASSPSVSTATRTTLHPGTMLTSMVKRVDVAVYNSAKAAKDGSWKAGVTVMDLAHEGVGWALDDNNKSLITAGYVRRRSRPPRPTSSPARSRCTITWPTTPAPTEPTDRLEQHATPPLDRAGSGDGQAAASDRAPPPAIELVGINKRFGSVQANRDVSLRVEKGTIHGIIGENGAGKSTLMSIVYGFYEADSGDDSDRRRQAVAIASSADAIAAGIGMVHQHFMLVDSFTVLENVMLGAEGGALLKEGAAAARAELDAAGGRSLASLSTPDAR